MVIFIHIPKTGGTTIIKTFVKAMNDSGSLIISDHYPYGIHKILDRLKSGHRKYQYFTVLRDPVKRMKSHLNYVFNNIEKYCNRANAMIAAIEDCGYEMGSFINRYCSNGALCNFMTMQLSGLSSIYNIDILNGDFDRMRIYNPFGLSPITAFSDSDMQKNVDVAKKAIRKMTFVAFTERLDADASKLYKKFSLNSPSGIGVYRKTGGVNWFEDNWADDILLKMNKFDVELYDYARLLWW